MSPPRTSQYRTNIRQSASNRHKTSQSCSSGSSFSGNSPTRAERKLLHQQGDEEVENIPLHFFPEFLGPWVIGHLFSYQGDKFFPGHQCRFLRTHPLPPPSTFLHEL